MFRVFACKTNSFELVRVARSALEALPYALEREYLVCDAAGGCYDEDELARLAALGR